MSLKILLADDNLTAQRMGTKILTDAGYEVIAVSNGAAAIKKIASDKPGLLILDVYMPGYTGLEVCEKIKNDPSTSQLPIILTVTNMEPFDPKEGDRVRADGLMIKPFEASDLVAVVQKFEAKLAKAAPAPAPYAQTQKIEEFKDASYEEWKAEASEKEAEARKIELPAEIAAAPALGFDEAIHPEAAVIEETAAFAVEAPVAEAAPAFGVEAAVGFEAMPAAFGAEEAGLPSFEPSAAPELSPETESLPSLDAAAALAPPAEFEATSAQQVGDIPIPPAAEVEAQASAADAMIAQDPALVTDPDEMAEFTTTVGEEHPEEVPVGIATPEHESVPEEAQTVEEPISAMPVRDLGDITTMKMPAYEEATPVAEAAPVAEASASAVEEQHHPPTVDTYIQNAAVTGFAAAAAAPAPEVEPEPAAIAEPKLMSETPMEPPAAEPPPIPDHLVAQFAAELAQAHEEREAREQAEAEQASVAEAHPEQTPVTESMLTGDAEVPAAQLDEQRIAAAINRALEKYKDELRTELIATILRELKG